MTKAMAPIRPQGAKAGAGKTRTLPFRLRPAPTVRAKPTKKGVAGWVVLGAVALFLLPALPYSFPFLLGGDHALVVLSGSMEPTFGPGDYIVVEKVDASELREGDVITFHATPTGGRLYTHRIIDVRQTPDMVLFATQGDANEDADPNPVRPEQLVGRQVAMVPVYGYLMAVGASWLAWLLLIALPSSVILLREVKKLRTLLAEGRASAQRPSREKASAEKAKAPKASRPADGQLGAGSRSAMSNGSSARVCRPVVSAPFRPVSRPLPRATVLRVKEAPRAT